MNLERRLADHGLRDEARAEGESEKKARVSHCQAADYLLAQESGQQRFPQDLSLEEMGISCFPRTKQVTTVSLRRHCL